MRYSYQRCYQISLAEYWSSEIVRDPNHPVPITKMINQTTKILDEIPKTMIKDAFDETAFQPALLAAEDDDTQIMLLMDDLMDEIEHNDNDWLSLYNEIMSHFPSLHGQNDNDEVELNQLEVQDEESNTSERMNLLINQMMTKATMLKKKKKTTSVQMTKKLQWH